MKKQLVTVMILCSAAIAAAADSPNPAGVPKDAQQVAPGLYRLAGKDGKNWMYRQTPFGYQKFEEKDEAKPESSPARPLIPESRESAGAAVPTPFGTTKTRAAVPVKITEDGELLRFERATPFGPHRWTRKKTELTEQEAKLWEEQRKPNTQTTDTK